MSKYYAQISGATNITTDFHPRTVYTGNSNYLKVKYNGDITTNATSACYVWRASTNWFSFEQGKGPCQYFNIGSSTYIGSGNTDASEKYLWNTSGLEYTTILTLNNGAVSAERGEQSYTGTFNGNVSDGAVVFFPTNETKADFYEYQVYGTGDTLLYDFVPYLSGETKGLYDKVNEVFYPAGNQSKITLVPYTVFRATPSAITATYEASSYTISLEAEVDMVWSATTVPSWVSLSSTGGTGSATITASIPKNILHEGRTGTIVFTNSDGDITEVAITQEKHPSLIPNNNIYRGGLKIN